MNPPNFLPIVISGQGQQSQLPHNQDRAPTRVQVALQFLDALSFKTLQRPAANDVHIEWSPLVELTTAEKNAQATACNLLNDYMKGKIKPDRWEKQSLDIDLNRAAIAQENNSLGRGKILHCPNCEGRGGNRNCGLCEGGGAILVFPYNGSQASESRT